MIAAVGCAATSGAVLAVIATVLVVAWQLVVRDPGFVRDVEPDSAHRVYVNRCCGGSMDGTEPLEIFYGSTQPFEQVVLHYRSEMEKRGFLMYPPQLRAQNDTYLSYRFKKKGWHHCFWIEPYTETYRLVWVNKDDLVGLSAYPFAYVATYIDADICDG